ncbi:hypothetical protein CL622_05025 [archaeon]|nr:hypothetical protein [archaeon]
MTESCVPCKQGQVAMEFLMTYGWAIIIILLAIAALWLLGVFSPSVSTTCQIEAPFTCQDAIVSEDSVIVRLGANQVQSATVNSITVNGQTCPQLSNTQFTSNQITQVRCFGISLEEDEKTTIQIDASYVKQGGGLTHSVEGSISGQASKLNYVYSGDPALVAAYDFEGDAKDATGNNNNGVIIGANCNTGGKVGNGCTFNGISDFINVSDPVGGDFDLLNDATIALFTKFNTVPPLEKYWVAKDEGPGNSKKWIFHWKPGTVAMEFHVHGEGVTQGTAQSSSWTPVAGQWYQVAVTKTSDTYAFYVDGVPFGTDTITESVTANDADLFIGQAEGTVGFFDGSIDHVGIWNRALSADEIKEYYDATK